MVLSQLATWRPLISHTDLSSVVSDQLKQQATSRASTPRRSIQEEQLDAYIGDHMVFDEKLDAIDFWIQN